MRAELVSLAEDVNRSLALLRRHLNWDEASRRLEELNALTEDPNLWNDASKAQALLKERNKLESALSGVRKLERDLAENLEMVEMAEAEGDRSMVADAEAALARVKADAAKRELESLLSGEADANDCFVEINSGAGGTEAQDWTEMLLRMYTRWAEQHEYKVFLIEESPGEEAGLKSATIQVSGTNAYGWLKTEVGVHRLVRISPFDSQARRQTSFAAVTVAPLIDDAVEVEIDAKDLRIDTYRAQGAGGQHINKTDSAVRVTHLPTGIVVASQQERSQHQNRAKVMQVLRSKLYELELKKREEKIAAYQGEKSDIGWGHQIRSYVLQPYQMVKDLRTGVEKGNAQGVLDGDLDDYLAAALAQRVRDGETGDAA